MISIQEEDFDHGLEYQSLRKNTSTEGAIVTFTGLVRDFNHEGSVSSILIESYAGMAEKSLQEICLQARERWDLGQIRLIHRIGHIEASAQIVFVGVTSKHRKDAFEAAQYIMDYLKTSAPFWKQEGMESGMKWVNAKGSDKHAMDKWQTKSKRP